MADEYELFEFFELDNAIAAEAKERRRLLRIQSDPFGLEDVQFMQRYRLSKELARNLCDELRPHMTQPTKATDLTVETKILTALSFYATGSYQRPTGDIAAHSIAQPTVSTVIEEVTACLNLPHIREKYIRFPQHAQERGIIVRKFYAEFGIPGVLGAIDCTHVAIVRPSEHEERYFCRKQYHSLNVQIICDADKYIMSVDASFGGATHDSFIWGDHPLNTHLKNISQRESIWFLEFLAEAMYISVDPYQRIKLGNTFPCDMIGGQIARVTESQNPDYPVGALVMGHFGWRTHTVVHPDNAKLCGQKPYLYRLPKFGDLPVSLGLGVCGRVGNTAYFGFTEICKPAPGETVVVSGAAGAVGSHVGQIAKILGCRVIGFAGSDEKCAWLVNELGFDCAANYKTVDVAEFLRQNAPNGIDCYFDNVGGELSSTVMAQMNEFGRVAVCGAIALLNETDPIKRRGTFLQTFIVGKQLKVEGFQVNRFADHTAEGIQQNLQWVKEGKLKYKNHIYDGFESSVDAFIGLFKGQNIGKSIVKV